MGNRQYEPPFVGMCSLTIEKDGKYEVIPWNHIVDVQEEYNDGSRYNVFEFDETINYTYWTPSTTEINKAIYWNFENCKTNHRFESKY